MKWDVFDIVGPIMVGPSSSHTSGAVRLGLFANKLIGGIPDEATIYLHGSYAQVYKGHGTDKSLIAGLLGIEPDSEKVIKAFEVAKLVGLKYKIIPTDLGNEYHPNTAKFILKKGKETIEIVGQSIGGGSIEIVEINGIKTNMLDGKYNTLITLQKDKPGVIAAITSIIAEEQLNIANMAISRDKKGGDALTILTLDGEIPEKVIDLIKNLKTIKWVRILPKLS
jgi:L-serine dehydratase